jgi:plastocyanin
MSNMRQRQPWTLSKLGRTLGVTIALLALGALPGIAAPEGSGAVMGRVTLKKPGGGESDPSGVVVYLESVPGGEPKQDERSHPQVHQRDLQFSPALTVVTTGTTVDFPNDDKVFHNVFSFSAAAKFDLGLYKSGSSKSVTFRRPGVVNVYCNIHPEMISKIKVLDTTFFAIVGKDGKYRIAGVPPGSYPVVAWQAHGPEFRGQVTIESGGTATVNIEVSAGLPELRHLRKDGTPYGRYK